MERPAHYDRGNSFDCYTGYDTTNDEFRTEPHGCADIMEFSLSTTPHADVVFALPLPYNTFTVRIGLSSNFDCVEYLWMLEAELTGVSDYTTLISQGLDGDNGLVITLQHLFPQLK